PGVDGRAQIARLGPLPCGADQSAGEHAVRGDADAEVSAGVQDPVLDAAGEHRVLDLQVADRCVGSGSPDRVGADLGQSDVADTTVFDLLGDRADGVLDWDVRVETGGAVDVDVVE